MAEAVTGWLQVLYVLILLCVYTVFFVIGIVRFSLKVPKYMSSRTPRSCKLNCFGADDRLLLNLWYARH